MKSRWFSISGLIIFLAVPVFMLWVYFASEAHLRSFKPPVSFDIPIPTDAASVARGDQLVRTRGCRGCHGEDLAGQVMWEVAIAPNLAAYARNETAATVDAAVRHGIGRDGRALYSMPSYNFIRLRDTDLADIIAYLRTVPVVQKQFPSPSLPWQVRLEIALGRDAAIPEYLHLVPPLHHVEDDDAAIASGEYIAMTTCNECHGFGLRADTPWDDETAPDLGLMIMAYSEEDFNRLMKSGVALGERELRLMSSVARSRFAYFSDDELADLYAFLRDMGNRIAKNQAD